MIYETIEKFNDSGMVCHGLLVAILVQYGFVCAVWLCLFTKVVGWRICTVKVFVGMLAINTF